MVVCRIGSTAGLEGLQDWKDFQDWKDVRDCHILVPWVTIFGSIWTPWGTILAPFGDPGAPFGDPVSPFWWPGDSHGPPMEHLGVQTWIFIDFRWILGSLWGPFWSHFGDFFVNWVTKWTVLVPGLIF